MSEPIDDAEQGSTRGRLARRRRANVAGGRWHAHRVRVTSEEQVRLAELAAEQQVSVPRLLVESALSQTGETPTQRREAMVELFAARRVLSGIAVNINQLAKHANAGDEFPTQAEHAVAAMHRVVRRVDVAVDELSRS